MPREAFIIMQIGNDALDDVCDQAIVPALTACGLDPRRVDRHNTGDLLKSEIVAFIEAADIIVADLTNERPNCYLEVGYAMGLGKKRNLILTVREDHHPDSPNYSQGGPKIHFDLSGYDILFWSPDDLEGFRTELEKRVRRRLAIIAPGPDPSRLLLPWDEGWIEEQRAVALPGLERTSLSGFMELAFSVEHPKPTRTQRELLDSARDAQIKTFGWPIGIVLDREDARPRPFADGIRAQVDIASTNLRERSWDYWALRNNGDFYMLHSLFEDQRRENAIFFDSRIVRVTESVLYCARLYTRLDLSPSAVVHFRLRHGGLEGRHLTVANRNRFMHEDRTSAENEVTTEIAFELQRVEADLVGIVRELLGPLFAVFDFFEPAPEVLEEIVNSFVNGTMR